MGARNTLWGPITISYKRPCTLLELFHQSLHPTSNSPIRPSFTLQGQDKQPLLV